MTENAPQFPLGAIRRVPAGSPAQVAKPNQHPFYTFMVAGRVVVQEP
jgi:hypothetical protein